MERKTDGDISMEECPKCKNKSLAQRSSYKICMTCEEIIKPDWRIKVEKLIRTQFGGISIVLAARIEDGFAVVLSKTTHGHTTEHMVHMCNLEKGFMFAGSYFVGEDSAMKSSLEFAKRQGRAHQYNDGSSVEAGYDRRNGIE